MVRGESFKDVGGGVGVEASHERCMVTEEAN